MNLADIADPTKPSKIKCPTCHQSILLVKDTQGRFVVLERHNSMLHRKGNWDYGTLE